MVSLRNAADRRRKDEARGAGDPVFRQRITTDVPKVSINKAAESAGRASLGHCFHGSERGGALFPMIVLDLSYFSLPPLSVWVANDVSVVGGSQFLCVLRKKSVEVNSLAYFTEARPALARKINRSTLKFHSVRDSLQG
jgi:hypothetical protein